MRTTIAISGLAMIGLAIGIYRRKLLAWRLGLVFLVATSAVSFLRVFVFTSLPTPLGVRIAESVATLVVLGIWMRWWYALARAPPRIPSTPSERTASSASARSATTATSRAIARRRTVRQLLLLLDPVIIAGRYLAAPPPCGGRFNLTAVPSLAGLALV
jgi:hypothetical protein